MVPHNETMVLNVSSSLLPSLIQCTDNGLTYSVGEKIVRDCEEKCTCKEGGFIGDCRPLCISPYVRAGRGIHDPLCEEKLVIEEPCCALLVCAADSGMWVSHFRIFTILSRSISARFSLQSIGSM